ncbi:hypothetical protein IWQ56_005761, partial [Coemansia nantahalensis]
RAGAPVLAGQQRDQQRRDGDGGHGRGQGRRPAGVEQPRQPARPRAAAAVARQSDRDERLRRQRDGGRPVGVARRRPDGAQCRGLGGAPAAAAAAGAPAHRCCPVLRGLWRPCRPPRAPLRRPLPRGWRGPHAALRHRLAAPRPRRPRAPGPAAQRPAVGL